MKHIGWLARIMRRNPERLLALLIRAHKIDDLERDVSRYFRAGYRIGYLNGVMEERERHGEQAQGEPRSRIGEDA